MRFFVPLIVLPLALLGGCGSRADAPATAVAQAAESTDGTKPPAPGEAQTFGASGADFNGRMSVWMKAGYYDDIVTASRARLEKEPNNGGALFSLVHALYYNGAFAEAATQAQKLAQMPEYQSNAKVAELIKNAEAMAARYPGQTFAPISWELSADEMTARKWQQLGTSLLQAGNYDEIERTAAQLTAKPELMANGNWTLVPFFKGLWSSRDEANWQKRREAIEKWGAAKPDSQLAQVALARCWTGGAWLARGGEYADQVSDAAWKTVEERQQKAAPLFRKLLQAPKITTPLLYTSAQAFGILGGAPREWQDEIFERAAADFPGYTDIYHQRAALLLERWDGAPGEWERFAAQTADAQPNKAAGDALYARIAWSQWDSFANLHDEADLDWPRLKRGFEAILEEFPGSLAASTVYVRMSHQWRDYDAARAALKITGGRGDSESWPDRVRWAQTRNFLLKAQ